MQRRNINTVVYVVTVFIVLAVAALVILRDDSSSNSSMSDSSSIGSAIQQFNTNNSSLLEHNISSNYPWTFTGDSSNKTDDNNNDEMISDYHDGQISDFSITDIARGGIITPIKSTSRSNKCTAKSKSLMRFTLTTDNYPVRTCVQPCVVCI